MQTVSTTSITINSLSYCRTRKPVKFSASSCPRSQEDRAAWLMYRFSYISSRPPALTSKLTLPLCLCLIVLKT